MLLKSIMSFNKLKIAKMFTYSVIEFNKLKFVLKYVKNSIVWNNVDTIPTKNYWYSWNETFLQLFSNIVKHVLSRIYDKIMHDKVRALNL